MNWAHLHLIVNHLPVFGTMFAVLFTLFAIRTNSTDLKKWSLVFTLFIAIMSIPVFFTGEPAEDFIERMPEINKTMIEKHEDFATAATIAFGALGLLALFGLVKRMWLSEKEKKFFQIFATSTLVVAMLFGWVANLGGKIRHTEIVNPVPVSDASAIEQ